MTRPTRDSADQAVGIDGFLAAEGFVTAESAASARAALEGAGITRPGKIGFSSLKLERARGTIEARIARVCTRSQCREQLEADGRQVVEVARSACEVCGGSNNQGAMRDMAAACRTADVRRVLVIGGTPRLHGALSALTDADGPDLRFVSGTEKEPNQRDALIDCAWADLVVVWAPTPLPHKVSGLYAADVCAADHVEVHRRGIEALAHTVADHLRRLPGRRVARR
jgi:hypothetical protein